MKKYFLILFLFLYNCEKYTNPQILKYNNNAEPSTLDPAFMVGSIEMNICYQLFEGLYVNHPKSLKPIPGVAINYNVSSNGLIYTFFLRTNSFWSDGKQVTADDFRNSWLRVLNPKNNSKYAYLLFCIKKAKDYYLNKSKEEEVGIIVKDKFILQVELESPTPFFINLTVLPTYMPVPIHKINIYNEKWTLPEFISCNGPFVLKEWVTNKYIILEKNDKYWDKKKVFLNKVIFYPYENENFALEKYLSNELDYLNNIPLDKIDELKKRKDYHKEPYFSIRFFQLNTTKSILSNKEIRKALYLSLDREYICNYELRNQPYPIYGFIPNGMQIKSAIQPKNENFWKKKARNLMAKNNFPDGKNFPILSVISMKSDENRILLEAIKKIWKKELGIDINYELLEWNEFLNRIYNRDFDICNMKWVGDYLDPHTFLSLFITDKGNNFTGWTNENYNKLIENYLAEKKFSKRKFLIQEAEKLLIDESPIIPIYNDVIIYLLNPKVKGIYNNLLDVHPLKEVKIE